jgi:hypothetical protein
MNVMIKFDRITTRKSNGCKGKALLGFFLSINTMLIVENIFGLGRETHVRNCELELSSSIKVDVNTIRRICNSSV